MFESEVEKDEGSVQLKRQAFLLTSTSAVAGLAVWSRADASAILHELGVTQIRGTKNRVRTWRSSAVESQH
jgi:hypothetical protein